MVEPTAGLEPATPRLQNARSTLELSRRINLGNKPPSREMPRAQRYRRTHRPLQTEKGHMTHVVVHPIYLAREWFA